MRANSATPRRVGQVVQAEVAHHGTEGVIGVVQLLAVADLEAGRRVKPAGQRDHAGSDVDPQTTAPRSSAFPAT
jgi:hypothetical protein